jgi:hypothetical protein
MIYKDYKNSYISIERIKHNCNLILRYNDEKMVYIDYTIKDALKLFKEYLKERVTK